MNQLNRQHQQARSNDSRLEARIRSYELAAAMQLSAPEALDISNEPRHILKLYGLDKLGTKYPSKINIAEEIEYFGRKCLVARRLVERGVRFVQIWSGMTTRFRAAIGTATKTLNAITAHWRWEWQRARPH